MARKPIRILICTEPGSFKQWILYNNGDAEWGAIGKKQQKINYPLYKGQAKAREKLNKGYVEYSQEQFDIFMEGYRTLCKHGFLAVSYLAKEEVQQEISQCEEEGRALIF